MPTKLGQLMPQNYFSKEDTWIVVSGKQEFKLNGKEVKLLKDATQANMRGIIWFNDFAISIPHITNIYKEKKVSDSSNIDWDAKAKERGIKV